MAQLQDDGNLVVYDPASHPLWDTKTGGRSGRAGGSGLASGEKLAPHEHLQSPSGHVTLWMQDDGNLVLYADGAVLWNSGTYGHPGSSVIMQPDGNLVVYDAAGHALWWSGASFGHPGAWLNVQDDGNLVVYDPASHPLWDTKTGILHPPDQALPTPLPRRIAAVSAPRLTAA